MANSIVRSETAIEYFKEMVDSAIEHQRVDAGELTSFYVVNLLCGFVHFDKRADRPDFTEPLALQLARALESGGALERAQLRRLGDVALFVSGFFSESVRRTLVDIDYYMALGGYAYGSLSRREEEAFADVYGELATKFSSFVDVLSEVSERSGLTSSHDLLRLYERWLRSGSPRLGRQLVERGVVPNASIGNRFVQ